ncbi:MAG: hypothetical protein MUF45_00480 [Spirosomaceae bacterium]|nr:hypothetical protein [Spirosomataceae bacterium]
MNNLKKTLTVRGLIVYLMLIPFSSHSQNTPIDNILKSISFKQDTIQSLFEWVAKTITYDVKRSKNLNNISSYIILSENEKIEKVLTDSLGVCEDYALVFNSLCRKLGYESYIVDGYVKNLTKIDVDFGHAWNVVKINGKWYCFDPTWSAGSVLQNTFHKEYNDGWFKVPPSEFIFTHVPYDPIWQLQEHPVIAEVKNINIPLNEYFNFEDSITTYSSNYMTLSIEKTISRIKRYASKNEIVFRYISYLEKKHSEDQYNVAVNLYNICASSFNTYINYRNHAFKKVKSKKTDLLNLLNTINLDLKKCKKLISNEIIEGQYLIKQICELNQKVEREVLTLNKPKKLF